MRNRHGAEYVWVLDEKAQVHEDGILAVGGAAEKQVCSSRRVGFRGLELSLWEPAERSGVSSLRRMGSIFAGLAGGVGMGCSRTRALDGGWRIDASYGSLSNSWYGFTVIGIEMVDK